jgi:hypothetical protein
VFWVFVKEKEGKSGHNLFLTGIIDYNLVFLLFIIVSNDADWSPYILTGLKNWGQGMGLVGSDFTVVNPLLNGSIVVPSIVPS